MNEILLNKALFVKRELTDCLRAANHGVQALGYDIDQYGREIVTIHYDNGYSREVNVSGDSHIAIISDVLRNL